MKIVRVLPVLIFVQALFAVGTLPAEAQQKKPKITSVTVKASPPTSQSDKAVYMASSELMGGWSKHDPSIKVDLSYSVDEGNVVAHLKITGTSPKEKWSYATSPRFVLLPGTKYRFSAWMRVDSLNNPAFPPFLNCPVWLENTIVIHNTTNRYDVQKMGEWQLLTREFITPELVATTGSIVLQKGTKDTALEATILLHDIRLEFVE